jgi:hypothetical protein
VRFRVRHLIAAAVVAGAVAGCGDEEPQIPRDQAGDILRRLQEADRRISQDPPVCGDLSDDTIPALEQQVASLPDDVDADIRESLDEGVAHLRDLLEAECADRREEPDTETTDTTDTTEETEPPTTTEETEPPTTTEETEPTPEPEPEPQPEPDEGNGSGGVPPGQIKKRDRD